MKNPLFPSWLIGSIVMRFTTHGQGDIHEFDYIGKIKGVKTDSSGDGYYKYLVFKVDIIKSKRYGEARDGKIEPVEVSCIQMQKLSKGLYIVYD